MISAKEISDKLRDNEYNLNCLSDEENEIFFRAGEIRNNKGKLVRHFKGKCYLIIDVVEHTETGEELVIYKAMYGDYKSYARPIEMFISKVDKQKYPKADQEYRFELVELNFGEYNK